MAIVLAGGGTVDAAGNAFAGTSYSVTKNTSVPTVALTGSVTTGAATNGSVNMTATFSEGVSGFVADDVTVSNGTVGSFAGGPDVYTFTVTATDQGLVTVDIPASVAEGVAAPSGRLNSAATQFGFTFDNLAPVTTATIDPTLVGTNLPITFNANGTGSAVMATSLLVRVPGDSSFVDSGLTPTGNTFTYTAAANGLYGFQVVSTDAAGNVEIKASADGETVVNTVANSELTLSIPADGTYTFPMQNGINVVVIFTGVTNPGTLAIGRNVGNIAPTGFDAARLIDQQIAVMAGGGLSFTSAVVVVGYDDTQLGSVVEGSITTAYRDNAGSVTLFPVTLDTSAKTMTFTTNGFSVWYFGPADATVSDWSILAD